MLTVGSSAMVTARISMFRILAAPHLWGFFVLHPPVTFSPRKCSRCPEKTRYLLHFAPKNVADTTLRQQITLTDLSDSDGKSLSRGKGFRDRVT